jgi:peptidoglycan/xylan/chitin deacetylase (PgdA/CDA1 family)
MRDKRKVWGMRIPGLKAFKSSRRRLRARFSDHALILGYHRIAKVVDDPYRMCVSPEHFAEHLEVLKLRKRPVSLSRLTKELQDGGTLSRKVVVTFDDGYLDVLENARSLLEQYGIPASVFVVTGSPGQVFWWDRLEAVYLYHPELEGQRAASPRDLLLKEYRKLKEADPDIRDELITEMELLADSGVAGSDLPRSMTAREIHQLIAGSLIEVGSHSSSHPWLGSLSLAQQREDISKSKSCLEEILGQKITSFSYPNGSVSKSTASIVEQLGFQYACTSFQDGVRKRTNPFFLPRIWVPDIDGEEFERWLSNW